MQLNFCLNLLNGKWALKFCSDDNSTYVGNSSTSGCHRRTVDPQNLGMFMVELWSYISYEEFEERRYPTILELQDLEG